MAGNLRPILEILQYRSSSTIYSIERSKFPSDSDWTLELRIHDIAGRVLGETSLTVSTDVMSQLSKRGLMSYVIKAGKLDPSLDFPEKVEIQKGGELILARKALSGMQEKLETVLSPEVVQKQCDAEKYAELIESCAAQKQLGPALFYSVRSAAECLEGGSEREDSQHALATLEKAIAFTAIGPDLLDLTMALVHLNLYTGNREGAAKALLACKSAKVQGAHQKELLRGLASAVLDLLPGQYELYELAASWEPDSQRALHMKLRGACAAIEGGAKGWALHLSSDIPQDARFIDQRVYLLSLKQFDEMAYFREMEQGAFSCKKRGTVDEEALLLKEMAISSDPPVRAYFQRLIEIYEQAADYQNVAKFLCAWVHCLRPMDCANTMQRQEIFALIREKIEWIEKEIARIPRDDKRHEKILADIRNTRTRICTIEGKDPFSDPASGHQLPYQEQTEQGVPTEKKSGAEATQPDVQASAQPAAEPDTQSGVEPEAHSAGQAKGGIGAQLIQEAPQRQGKTAVSKRPPLRRSSRLAASGSGRPPSSSSRPGRS